MGNEARGVVNGEWEGGKKKMKQFLVEWGVGGACAMG